jgi:hypothetical protein
VTNNGVTLKPFRVLIGGFINVNVIDGSAFFLAGVASMCAAFPSVQVTLVTANPISRWEVLDELRSNPNVTIVDPYVRAYRHVLGLDRSSPSRRSYAQALLREAGDHDAILIRDNATAVEFVRLAPDLAARTTVYLTGLTDQAAGLNQDVAAEILELEASGAHLACQTEAMADVLRASGLHGTAARVQILPPHVPDAEGAFDKIFHFADRPSRLVYTGKFFPDWIPDKILAAFRSAARETGSLRLDVAGDQFRDDASRPDFVSTVRYFLEHSERVRWHRGLPRREARALIEQAEVGIGWRSERLDTSTELSTKILEYGALARPAIVNRTAAHEALLGSDYPLFANSFSEFRALLANLPAMGSEVELAARRCFSASRDHWYSTVGVGLLEMLGCSPGHRSGELVARFDSLGEVVERRPVATQFGYTVMWGNLLLAVAQGKESLQASTATAEASWLIRGWRRTLHDPIRPAADRMAAEPGIDRLLDEMNTDIQRLQSELALARSRASYVEARLEALRASRLGRLQRWVWSRRSGTTAPAADRAAD